MKSLRIVAVLIIVIVQGAFTSMGETYKPEFSFRKGRVYDGERQIARITPGRTFSEVVLRPGGEKVLEWIWMRSEKPRTFSLAEQSTPQKLVLTADLRQQKDFTASIETVLTYDAKLNSYVYDFSWERRLKKRPASCKNTPELADPELARYGWYGAALEYCNLGASGRDQSYWRYMVYQASSGKWLKIPFNHYLTLQQLELDFKSGGALLGFFGEQIPLVNPVVELIGSTADDTVVGICDGGYDYHLKLKPNLARRRQRARFRVYCLGFDEGRALIRKAKLRYSEAEMSDWQRPVFRYKKGLHFTADFEQPNRQTATASEATWQPYGDVSKSCWMRQGGYKSKGCIRIGDKDTPVICHWALGGSCGPWPMAQPGKTYKLSAYIKTENLRGKGACIVADMPFVRLKGKDNYSKNTRGQKRIVSKRLTGTNGWTKVELQVPSLGYGPLNIWLCHEGTGVSWFGNVVLEGDVIRYDEARWPERFDKQFRNNFLHKFVEVK